ncbi:MAG: hypothetical protein D6683_13600 [Actinomyces sp.]|nr:MAG: hypothetical protein D6683_13600 [Actinomyces sp.]
MRIRPRLLAGAAAAALAIGVSSPALAQSADASSPDPAAPAAPAEVTTTATVPVFGTDLTITVVTTADGDFVSADLTTADGTPAPDYVKVEKIGDHDGKFKVSFVNDTTGVKIEVKGKDGKIGIETEIEPTDGSTPTVDAVAGTHTWMGDPFGNGGSLKVTYTVGVDADGNPTLTVDNVEVAGDVFAEGVWTDYPLQDQKVEMEHDEYKVEQKILVWNAANDSGTLKIEVEREHGEVQVKAEFKLDKPKSHDDDDDHHESDHDDHDDDHHDDDHHGDHDED